MTESTGFIASTLHSALGLVTDDDDGDYMNSDDPLEYDFIIVDEFSMVDMRLASRLFSRIRGRSKILLVGDADQLPSVGAGNVFREFINCKLIPATVLDVVFRQSDTSKIALNAQSIRENKSALLYGGEFEFIDCETEEQAAKIIQEQYMREVKAAGVDNVQILSPFRKRGSACVNVLNEAVRELVNPKTPMLSETKAGARVFRSNDKVMQIRNKYEISNGDMGKILFIDKDSDNNVCVTVKFSDDRIIEYGIEDLNMIEHAYAVTIHKSQGSEYETVIIPMLNSFYIMLKRNLIYTAVTRAKRKVILVGQKQALATAIKTNDIDRRNTMLGDRIRNSYNALTKPAC
jgi:exodeoxyribonuclease V alpha subunit